MQFKIKALSPFLVVFLLVAGQAHAQTRVLFIGNSYTAANNLPKMTANFANSVGDSILFDSNSPGGQRLKDHWTNATTLQKITAGNWDYVVLQDQSQLPSFPDFQVQADMYPYAFKLDSLINAANPCAETVFYRTWGRKNGDAMNCPTWPPVCTYAGMDSLLGLRYQTMADTNDAIVAPVGAVWKYLRQNQPQIELYTNDESHPTAAGTYAAACAFYTVIFRKDPTFITFNSTLSTAEAAAIRLATKLVVFDSLLNWNVGKYEPAAGFQAIDNGGGQVLLTNSSTYTVDYAWDFGDGTTSIAANPSHTYTNPTGTYTITLIASKCGKSDTAFQTITFTTSGVQSLSRDEVKIKLYPNPSTTLGATLQGEITGYTLTDAAGSIVESRNSVSNTTTVGAGLAPGLYLLTAQRADKQTETLRLVIGN